MFDALGAVHSVRISQIIVLYKKLSEKPKFRREIDRQLFALGFNDFKVNFMSRASKNINNAWLFE